MKWFKRITFSLTVLFFAVCCSAVLLFNWSALGWKALSVQTGSMRPAIPQGSLVLMHRVPDSSMKVGDVITYTNPRDMHTTITHRIGRAYKLDGKIPAYLTRGDANPSADPLPVVGGQVHGKVVWHVPFVGKIMDFSRSWAGLIVLIYLPALLVTIEEILRLSSYFAKAKVYKSAYILTRYKGAVKPRMKFAQATAISLACIAGSVLIAFPVQAVLRSNPVTLGPNNISVAAINPPNCPTGGNNTTVIISSTNTGGGNNSNSANVININHQDASSGNVNANGNTTVGSVSSGNASNTNCTTTIINQTNH